MQSLLQQTAYDIARKNKLYQSTLNPISNNHFQSFGNFGRNIWDKTDYLRNGHKYPSLGCGLLSNMSTAGYRGGGFTDPTDIAGLKLWLDADDLSTFTLTGSDVDQWDDKSGEGNHVTDAGASKPVRTTGAMNGKAVVTFSSDDRALQRTTFTGGAIALPYTSFIVFQSPSDGGAANGTYVLDGGGAGSRPIFVCRTAAQNDYQGDNSAGGSLTFNTDQMITQLHKAAAGGYMRRDGIDIITGVTNGETWNGITIADHYTLGNPSSTDDLDGEVAEIIIYDSELSTGDRDDVEAYLKDKWGTP